MSKTTRNGGDGTIRTDGGRHYSRPRYRPGSRQRQRQLSTRPVRRRDPDLGRFGRAVVEAALAQAEAETAARHEGHSSGQA
jgi:hypothetical protein